MEQEGLKKLDDISRQIRLDVAKMFHKWGHGHFGGSYSCVEILATVFFHEPPKELPYTNQVGKGSRSN